MNDLGHAVARAALHVTLAAVPAVLLVAWFGRRRPAEGGFLAGIAVAMLAVLALAAPVPLPDVWTWDRPAAVVAEQTPAEEPATASSPSTGLDLPWNWLMRWPTAAAMPAQAAWSAWDWAGVAFAAGLLIEAGRLLAGVVAVARCRRSSRPVVVGPMLDELCGELVLAHPIEVRASDVVASAATIGWRRPVVLLATDWRDWPADDLRAVLAHELAHVRRRDYLTGLVARLCVLANFYHPLARWLAARQRLAQEMAADALAAPLAGGRANYLRALARLALRQDSRPRLAQAFFADRNGLERRIAMLRVTDDARRTPALRWMGALGIVAAALAASALRGPAQPPPDKADKPTPVREGHGPAGPAAPGPITPLSLEYLTEKTDAFIAIRPAMLLTRPEMKPLAERWNGLIAARLKVLGFGPGFTLRLDEIDQILGPLEVKTYSDEELKASGGDKRHAAMLGASVLRTTRDVDWLALFDAVPAAAGLKRLKANEYECRLGGPLPMTLTVIDARTVIANLTPGVKAGMRANADRWRDIAPSVERAGLAIVLNNRDGHWTSTIPDIAKEDPLSAAALKSLVKAKMVAYAAHWDESVRATFTVEAADAQAAAQIFNTLGAIRTLLLGEIGDPKTADEWAKLAIEMLDSATAQHSGTKVTAEGRAATRWADLLGKFPLERMFAPDAPSGKQ